MSSNRVRRRVTVHGRVQGVFFRDSCRREAERRRVSGWVRNRSDGTVEAAFEGTEDAVESMIEWSRAGPAAARVYQLDVVAEPPEDVEQSDTPGPFRIL